MKKFNIQFVKNTKKFVSVSAIILAIGLVLNVILGTSLDIQFTGGAIVSYSYTGDIDSSVADKALEEVVGTSVEIQSSYNVYISGEETTQNSISVSISDSSKFDLDKQEEMLKVLEENFADNNFQQLESNSVPATMGSQFFAKCMVAIALASALMLLYVAFRFRKIGGWTAGMMALVALINDIAIAYFSFVIFRIPLDDNFVAVVLTILGYSLNSTIVIYDRIRENRRLMGPKTALVEVVDLSINQSLGRSINTSLTTFITVTCVTVVAVVYGIDSILSFSIPMMFGIASGFFTSTFITAPVWVYIQKAVAAKKAEKKAMAKAK